jgi:protein TonB
VGGHVLLLMGIVGVARVRPVRVFRLPGTMAGTRVELAYMPGRAPAVHPTTREKPKPQALPQIAPAPEVAVAPPTPSTNRTAPVAPTPDASSGSDSWGSGSVEIALTTYSPSPKPDLTALPHGVQGDVVVDVTIDPDGKVADLAVLHTLGYGIESSVIGTLKTWTFRPARKDGTPIASVQELHFHFGPV